LSPDTAALILDVAQELVQAQGFNAISYQDIAHRVGIRKASIHHHFPSKANLGAQLVARYRARWNQFLSGIDQSGGGAPAKLERYIKPFRSTACSGDRVCLCGVLGAEFASLAPEVQSEVRSFFSENERWLARLLNDGRTAGTFQFRGAPDSQARVVFSCLEGTLLVARACGERARFNSVVTQLKAGLGIWPPGSDG
jgi:TetR/AcrR family transcriptional repressor of nem operon